MGIYKKGRFDVWTFNPSVSHTASLAVVLLQICMHMFCTLIWINMMQQLQNSRYKSDSSYGRIFLTLLQNVGLQKTLTMTASICGHEEAFQFLFDCPSSSGVQGVPLKSWVAFQYLPYLNHFLGLERWIQDLDLESELYSWLSLSSMVETTLCRVAWLLMYVALCS